MAYFGGGPGERQPRQDWRGAGVPLLAPKVASVSSGIDAIIDMLDSGGIVVYKDCEDLIAQLGSYRHVNKDGEILERIEDKESYHLIDALRYMVLGMMHGAKTEDDAGMYRQEIVHDPVRVGVWY